MHLSAVKFKNQFDLFNDQVIVRSGQPFRSFQEGLPSDWEEYKDRVWHAAQEELAVQSWRKKDIGSGSILRAVVSAIEIKRSSTLRNNLVAWDGRRGPKSRSHLALVEASSAETEQIERWAFDFYHGAESEPRTSFDELMRLVGKRYDVVAYLFFLKNMFRYVPIATKTFDKAFSMLGVDLVTTMKCSWENYSRYNATIAEVRRLLVEVAGVADARLLDAHSFCWMLAKLKTPQSPARVPPPLNLVSNLSAVKKITAKKRTKSSVFTEEDFIQREENQRRLGRLAQDTALESEQKRLEEAGHFDPSGVVLPVWDEPARGYDILSTEMSGAPRHIEVKAARRTTGGTLSFMLSSNEFEKSRSLPNYWFYLVIGADSDSPELIVVRGREVLKQYLKPTTFQASFLVGG